jgi:hypothetical protein
VADAQVRQSVDVYENRLLRTFLRQVEQRLRRVATALREAGNADLATEADALLATLARAKRAAAFLGEVSELDRPAEQVTMVLLKRPPYRALLEAYLAFQRSLEVRFDNPALDALASTCDRYPMESLS